MIRFDVRKIIGHDQRETNEMDDSNYFLFWWAESLSTSTWFRIHDTIFLKDLNDFGRAF